MQPPSLLGELVQRARLWVLLQRESRHAPQTFEKAECPFPCSSQASHIF